MEPNVNPLDQIGGKAGKGKDKGGLRAAKNWYADRYETTRVQRNFLAVVTLVAAAVSLFSAWSVSQLTPLKTVKPFVIQVDDRTGITQIVEPKSLEEISANEAIKSYFVMKYIRARESYHHEFYRDNYNIVRLMSPSDLFASYKRAMAPQNENSVINIYARESSLEVQFKSLTFIDQNTAQVRLQIIPKGRMEGKVRIKDAIVWTSFEFANLDLKPRERYINPLGFRVLSYRVDEEYSVE